MKGLGGCFYHDLKQMALTETNFGFSLAYVSTWSVVSQYAKLLAIQNAAVRSYVFSFMLISLF